MRIRINGIEVEALPDGHDQADQSGFQHVFVIRSKGIPAAPPAGGGSLHGAAEAAAHHQARDHLLLAGPSAAEQLFLRSMAGAGSEVHPGKKREGGSEDHAADGAGHLPDAGRVKADTI